MSLARLATSSHLLDGLSPEGTAFLDSLAIETTHPAETVIFREDDRAESFYLVASGKVGLEVMLPARSPTLIETLGPGELVGVSWLFPPYRWNWRARALEQTRLLAFDAETVRSHLDDDLDLAVHVYRAVAEEAIRRLHATRIRLLDLYPGVDK